MTNSPPYTRRAPVAAVLALVVATIFPATSAPSAGPAPASRPAGAAAGAADDAIAAARQALKANPSDPAANLAVGRFLCFEKGDWGAGLPMLAKGSDAGLREMAAKDLGVADVAIARTVLGHDWWDYATGQSGEARVRCRERAAYWYRVSLAGAAAEMPAGERVELRKRVAEADSEAAAFYAKAGRPRPFDPAAIALDRKLLEADETGPLEAVKLSQNKAFAAANKPWLLKGTISVEGDKPVKLTFPAGFEVRGGTIDLGQRGQAIIKGTAEKPAVFRDVTFFQDLGASLSAENAVFDHCKFNKGGAWFSYHSSKWQFADCVLFGCAFGRLTGVDYGFQIRHCALVSMDLPEVAHEHKPGFDHMAQLRGEWNKIESCDFVDCTVPPTVAWCGEGCNFRRCRFVAGEAFESPKDLDWSAYVTDPVGPGPEAAWAEHPAPHGKVKHVQPDRPFETTHFASGTSVSPLPEVRFENGVARLLVPHLGKAGAASPAQQAHPAQPVPRAPQAPPPPPPTLPEDS